MPATDRTNYWHSLFWPFSTTGGLPILLPDITYSFYKVYTSLFKINCEKIPLEDDFSIRPELFYKKNGGVVIANPNAPTGMFLPLKDITGILEHNPDQVVIVDEAYIDFGGISAVKLIGDYPNLLVIKTLSKSRSLAGLRVGYALAQKGLIEGIDRIKNSINSYTLDRLALAGAVAAIKDETYFQEVRQRIIMTRERVSNTMEKILFKNIYRIGPGNGCVYQHSKKHSCKNIVTNSTTGMSLGYN